MTPRVVIVPGLAVRSYAVPAVTALRGAGYHVDLLRPPAWRHSPLTVTRYGESLAQQLEIRGETIDLLVGLSVGSQAAALATVLSPLVRQLLLVSPTIDPQRRSVPTLLGTWLRGDPSHSDPGFREQIPDWWKAGIPRIVAGFVTALNLPIEQQLDRMAVDVTIVHTEHDYLGSPAWAQSLAEQSDSRLVQLPGQSHSWPYQDPAGFVSLVDQLVKGELDVA